MADGILAAVNENGNIDRFIDTKGGVHYIEPKRYEESVAKIDAAAAKAKETVNSATEAVSECKAQTGACTQETARAKEIADTVESRITGIEGDIATLGDSVSQNEYPKVICGSVVRNASGFDAVMVFSKEQFKDIAGREFDNGKDCISVINADGNASGSFVMGVIYDPNTKHIDAHLSGTTGAIRLNYIITLGA